MRPLIEAVGLCLAIVAGTGLLAWFEREPHPIMAECIRRATEDQCPSD